MSKNFLIVLLSVSALTLPACNRQKSQEAVTSTTQGSKRYAFKGKIMSIDKNIGTANIENEDIPGFMAPMVMPYSFKPPSLIANLQPGDAITAEVVLDKGEYWLENVKVTGHSQPASQPTSSLYIPQPGDDVPDFHLVNQSGKNISLHQYHGETLLLTLIYTRCPFPDYCPRVSHEFAAIDRQLLSDPGRYGKTHLLSISFDPAHDTPKVLRAYGFNCAASKDPALFSHWEFTAIPQSELSQFANYFALTYKEEDGVLTHSLSTAVIAPDGKIFRWYRGADWRASDLLQDVEKAKAAG